MAEDQFIERRIVMGLLTNTNFAQAIVHVFDKGLLQANSAQRISGWCVKYYNKYKKAPGRDIETIYGKELRRGRLDEDQAEEIEDILSGISDELEHADENIDVLIDDALLYIQERKLLRLADDIKESTISGNLLEAQAQIATYTPTQKLTIEDTDFFVNDPKRTKRVFESVPEPIITYPGKLGQLLNSHMVRGGFVGFLGQEKVGKTWTLMDIAFQAQRNNRKVAFFAAGDMNRDEMDLRKHIYLSKKSNDIKYCGELLVPRMDCWANQTGECEHAPGMAPFESKDYPKDWKREEYFSAFEQHPDHEVCIKCRNKVNFKGAPWFRIREKVEPLHWKEAYKRERKFLKLMRGNTWHFMETPADTLCPSMIDNQLAIWNHEGFIADIILVDYPDIMTVDPEDMRQDFRHRENAKWKKLRALSHKYHALTIAVTQADANAYNKKWIDLSNYSEDKRKYSHATAFFGLNQTDEEAELGLFRINQLIVRSGKRGSHFATVLQRLEMGRPHLGSF